VTEIWLNDINDTAKNFRLPVNPESISVRRDKPIETVSLLRIGEVDFTEGTKIAEISFESFFPAKESTPPPYVEYSDYQAPRDSVAMFDEWVRGKFPLRFIVADSEVKLTNLIVIVSSFEYRFEGGQPDDIYYTVNLREWREVKVRKKGEIPPSTSRIVSRPSLSLPKMYTVVKGDTLMLIAKRVYGNGKYWWKIFEQPENKRKLGSEVTELTAGTKLVIPK